MQVLPVNCMGISVGCSITLALFLGSEFLGFSSFWVFYDFLLAYLGFTCPVAEEVSALLFWVSGFLGFSGLLGFHWSYRLRGLFSNSSRSCNGRSLSESSISGYASRRPVEFLIVAICGFSRCLDGTPAIQQ